MTIETKFNVYDEIHFIGNKKSTKSIVREIKIEIKSCPIEISTEVVYLCNNEPDAKVHIRVNEEDAYPSKKELLESI